MYIRSKISLSLASPCYQYLNVPIMEANSKATGSGTIITKIRRA